MLTKGYKMARENCSKCGKPRELSSSSASYCKKCLREYHRNRYRNGRLTAGLPLKVRTLASETEPEVTSAEQEQQMHNIFRAMIANSDPAFCSICDKDLENLPTRPLFKRAGSYNDPRTRILEPRVILRLVCEDCSRIVDQIFSWGVPLTGRIMKICLESTLFMEDTAPTEQGTPTEKENVKVLEFGTGEKYKWEMLGPPKPEEMVEWDHGRFVARYESGPAIPIPEGLSANQTDAYTKAAYQGISIHDERSPLRKLREQ